MIVADFAPLTTSRRVVATKLPSNPQIKTELDRLLDATRILNSYPLVQREAATYREGQMLEEMLQRTKDKVVEGAVKFFFKTDYLPDEIKGVHETISRITDTPMIELKDVRRLADALSFAVIPFDYLDERSYQGEEWSIQSAIKGFAQSLSPWYHIYVLAPVAYYDVYKHVEADEDMDIYAGTQVASSFMTISMTTPMFRTIFAQIENLREQVRDTKRRVSAAENEIGNIVRRLQDLAALAERQQQEIIMAKVREENMRQELAELRARAAFMAYEPMMLAIPKGQRINDDVKALVGPCWGPDFADIVVTALGFEKVAGQRKKLAQLAARWSR